ncbi:ubiquinol-cytochrome C chaperone [Rhizobiaceae bacterium]|nr:ubiquinol-cytochrome C chaperone [Rhizobiaceae bacterium]
MFRKLFGRGSALHDAHAIYGQVVTRARDERLFATFGVPDTFDGRFEMLVLHLFLIHHRLKGEGERSREVSQCVFDSFIDDMDAALREAAVGDQAVPKRINKMTRVFYGRTGAFEEAMASSDSEAALATMMARNIHPDDEAAPDQRPLARYLLAEAALLEATSSEAIIKQADVFTTDWTQRSA